ncbi:MAG: hypothetical protein HY393_02980 [Candidatus Diapherotrites archaeon]|nr:hypothetical protein [Candidatus Diapherotrites archaeon]
MNLYEIRDKALRSGRAVFSVQQLANLISSSKLTAKVYASRLVRKKLARRLVRGKIAFTNDDYVVATQLIEPAYISLYSALLMHQLIQQVPADIECVTPKVARRLPGVGVNYHRIPSSLFFGFERVKADNDYYFLAIPEKALIDGLYLRAYSKSTVAELMKKINRRRLNQLLDKIPEKTRKRIEGEMK